LIDERGEDFLSGHAGDSQAIGGLCLPHIKRAVCGGRKVDGASCSLSTRWLVSRRLLDDPGDVGLVEALEALGCLRVLRRRGSRLG
jgi:hypothetical protein